MSFSGPLGSGRRLDHHQFINGGKPDENRPPSRQSLLNSVVYSDIAPDLPSSQRNPSPTRPPSTHTRSKLTSRGPALFHSPPKPNGFGFDFKDTSVNIATAFHQAAAAEMPSSSVNGHRKNASTSLNQTRSHATASLTGSIAHVSDSESEGGALQETDAKGRPLSKGTTSAGLHETLSRALSPAAYYVRERSRDPEDSLSVTRQISRESSYDYIAEQSHYEDLLAKSKAKRAASQEPIQDSSLDMVGKPTVTKRQKNRISMDNQAWKPGKDDDDYDDDYDSDNGRKRRRRRKKDEGPGKLINLPTVDYSKKRKGRKSVDQAAPEVIEEEPEEEEDSFEQPSMAPSVLDDQQPTTPYTHVPHQFIDAEIKTKPSEMPQPVRRRSRSRSRSLPPEGRRMQSTFSPGAALGVIVRISTYAIVRLIALLLQVLVFLVRTPLGITLLLCLGIGLSYMFGLHNLVPSIALPRFGHQHNWEMPQMPPSTLEEFIRRLTNAESALEDLRKQYTLLESIYERERKLTGQTINRISLLEDRLDSGIKREFEAIDSFRSSFTPLISGMKDEVTMLKSQYSKLHSLDTSRLESSIKVVDARVDGVEHSLSEVQEHIRSNTKARHSEAAPGSWWTGKSGLTIKCSDDRDVIALLEESARGAVERFSKDVVAKPDFALYSAGGRVVPSLTTSVFEHRPSSWTQAIFGYPFGIGRAIGKPPVYALNNALTPGECWSFEGSHGQLAVVLARSVYISEFTVDHVAPELAFDLRTAPRDIEVWGYVEGKDNIAKYNTYLTHKRMVDGPELVPQWVGAPRGTTYMQLAKFTYDIHARFNIQSFLVAPEIQDLGIDFGLIVFRILSNWGSSNYTCLYRVRVHGLDKDASEPLLPPESIETSN